MRNTICSGLLCAALLCLTACDSSGTRDTVVVSSSAVGTIDAVVGGGSHTVQLTFNTDDGKPASKLYVYLGALPSGWSAPSSGFSCATVSTGNGCLLDLTYAPASDDQGAVTLQYGYINNAGVNATGTVQIAYQATAHDNVIGTASPSGQVSAMVGATRAVTITFATDDSNAATNLLMTTDLGALPSGWTVQSPPFSCSSVSTGNGCQLALTYAPTSSGTGTLTLGYSFTDNAGAVKTGTLAIPFASTTNDNAVATVSPGGTVAARAGASQAVTITFTTDDGNIAGELSISNSALGALPSGWSGSNTFSCTTFSTGSSCRLSLMFAPTAAASGTLQLGYTYRDNAGAAKTGTVSISYAASAALRAYIGDQQLGVVMCAVGANGALGSCTPTGSGFSYPFSVALSGTHAYVTDVGNNSVNSCPVNQDGTLGACTVALSTPQAGNLEVNGSYLYVPWGDPGTSVNGPTVCAIAVDGSLSACAETGADPSETSDVAFLGQYVFVSTYAQHGAGLLLCAAGSNGSISGCSDVNTGEPQAFSTAIYQGHIYMTSNSGVTICAIGSNATLSNCATSLPFAVGAGDPNWTTQAAGGFAVSDGYAYLSYYAYQFMGAGQQQGVAVCTVDADGSLSNCADSGATFGAPYGITLH
jgi:hypothetical protein